MGKQPKRVVQADVSTTGRKNAVRRCAALPQAGQARLLEVVIGVDQDTMLLFTDTIPASAITPDPPITNATAPVRISPNSTPVQPKETNRAQCTNKRLGRSC